MAIMQQLSNIVSAVSNDLKPALRDRPQFTRMLVHPDLNSWIALDRSGEPHKLAHGDFILGEAPLVSQQRRVMPFLRRAGRPAPARLCRFDMAPANCAASSSRAC